MVAASLQIYMGRCPKVCGWQVSLISPAFPSRGRLGYRNTASPIQPPPLRGTSFRRKEGVSTRAPSLGRGCRAQRGGVGFLFCGEAASSFPSRLCFGYSRILVSQPSPRGNAIKLSGRTFLALHRESYPKGLCKRTGFLGVKRRENPVRRHFERSEMRGLRSGIA